MVGASVSSVVLLTLLAPLLVLAIASGQGFALPPLRRLLLYAGAHFYLVVYAIAYLSSGAYQDLAASSPVNSAYPRDFAGHFWLIADRKLLLWPAIASAAGLLFALFADSAAKRMLGTWFALCGLLYLNPLSAPLLIEHVTSSNIYWRVFYLLPIPLLVALALGHTLRWAGQRFGRGALAGLAFALCVAALATPSLAPSASIFKRANLGAPRYNLPPYALAAARKLVAHPLPSGPMLAPLELCGIVPMLASGYPQLVRRNWASPEKIWLRVPRDPLLLQRRLGAVRFASGKLANVNAFMQTFATTSFRSIVLHRTAWRHLQERQFEDQLHARGFNDPATIAGWIVLVRPEG
jgi:hypothetical protein